MADPRDLAAGTLRYFSRSLQRMRVIEQYERIREIGHGGVSSVYLARHRALNREGALKGALPRAENFARLVRSAEITARMNHPRVAKIFDCFEHDGLPHLVFEYLPRGSLRRHIGQLTLEQIAGVVEAVLAALGHASSKGVVHRDIKPDNLLVAADGQVKLIDFSVAHLPAELRVTPPEMAVGTPRYMSPEQARGSVLDVRTDLYSLGLVVFELVADTVPHSGDTPYATMVKRINEP